MEGRGAHHARIQDALYFQSNWRQHMLHYAVVFLVIALIAGFFGFFGIAGLAASIAKILFVIFLVLFVVSLIFGRGRL